MYIKGNPLQAMKTVMAAFVNIFK